jgi:hypothetical protein
MISLGGCSWLFQAHETHTIPDHERQCATTPRWWILDGIVAASQGAGVLVEGTTRNPNAVLMSVGVAIGVVYTISAAEGYRWAGECERSRTEYRNESARNGQAVDEPMEGTPATAPHEPPHAARQPGLFCAGDGVCARDIATCDEERNMALATAPDLGVCAPAERAWCFDAIGDDERCFATRDGCMVALAAATRARGECEGRR